MSRDWILKQSSRRTRRVTKAGPPRCRRSVTREIPLIRCAGDSTRSVRSPSTWCVTSSSRRGRSTFRLGRWILTRDRMPFSIRDAPRMPQERQCVRLQRPWLACRALALHEPRHEWPTPTTTMSMTKPAASSCPPQRQPPRRPRPKRLREASKSAIRSATCWLTATASSWSRISR